MYAWRSSGLTLFSSPSPFCQLFLLPVPSFHPSSLLECGFANVPSSDSQLWHVSTHGSLPDQSDVTRWCRRKNHWSFNSNCCHPGYHGCYPGYWICQLSNRNYYCAGKCLDVQVSLLLTSLHWLMSSPSSFPPGWSSLSPPKVPHLLHRGPSLPQIQVCLWPWLIQYCSP